MSYYFQVPPVPDNGLPATEPYDIYQVPALIEEIGDNTDVLTAYKEQWQKIRTHYENRGPGNNRRKRTKRVAYVIRHTNASVGAISTMLRQIHQEQLTAYKFNLQLSFLMRHVDTNKVRLYYHE